MTEQPREESYQVNGPDLIDRVKELIEEGNVRRLVIRQDDRTIVEVPLFVGAIAALLAPQLAAIGAIAALLTHCTLVIERHPAGPGAGEPPSPSI